MKAIRKQCQRVDRNGNYDFDDTVNQREKTDNKEADGLGVELQTTNTEKRYSKKKTRNERSKRLT